MLHYSSQFCNELSKKHNIKVVIADYYNWPLYDEWISFLKIKTNPSFLSFIFDTLLIWNHIFIIYKIIKYNPDIIHFMDNHPWYLFYCPFFKKIWYTIYVTQHNPTQHSWEYDTIIWKIAILTNKMFRVFSDKLIVHWDVLKKELITKYNVLSKKIISVPHWNYTFFNKYSKWRNVKKNTFLFFWRINDYKWLDILLDSIEIVKKEINDFTLLIVWSWSLSKYSNSIKCNKKNIEIYNYTILDSDVCNYFEISEFVVLPYKDATWSWVIPMSYCFAKPVIATNVWWIPLQVIDWETWFLIKPNNAIALAEKIIFMLKNKEIISNMWKKWKNFSDVKLWWLSIVEKIYN